MEIGQPLRPLGGVEPAVEGPGCLLVDGQQLFPALSGLGGGAKFGHLHSHPLGQHRNRVFKRQVFQLHYIVDSAAPLAAAEALVHLPVGHHMEGRGLFAVEGTAAPVAVPLFGQPNRLGYQVHNVGPGQQLVQKTLGQGQRFSPLFVSIFWLNYPNHNTVHPLGINSS